MKPYSKKAIENPQECRDIANRAMLKVILIYEALIPNVSQTSWEIFIDNRLYEANALKEAKYNHDKKSNIRNSNTNSSSNNNGNRTHVKQENENER